MTDTHFHRHLYFEDRPNSREYKIDALMNILKLIASLMDRNEHILHYAKEANGTSALGFPIVNERDYKRYTDNKTTIQRLKRYYNYRLSLLQPFEIKTQ